VWDNSGPSLSELLKQRQSSPAPVEHKPEPAAGPATSEPNVESVDLNQLPEVWQRMLDLLAARGAWLHSAMKTGRLACIEDDAAVLRFDKNHATFVKMLSNKKELLRDIFSQAAGKPLGVRFEVDEDGAANGHGETASAGDGGLATMAPAATATRAEAARAPARPIQREAAPPPPVPATNLIKITPELVETLKTNEPLIKGLIDELGAQVVKIEAPESVATS
jgi:hypothetical protein